MTTERPVEDEGNVVQLRPADPDADLTVVSRGFVADACQHIRVTVDAQARTLTCRGCEALLDPLTFLESWAKRASGRQYRTTKLEKLLAETRVHALSGGGSLTLCGIGGERVPGRLTVTGNGWHVTCQRCRAKVPQQRGDGREWITSLPLGEE